MMLDHLCQISDWNWDSYWSMCDFSWVIHVYMHRRLVGLVFGIIDSSCCPARSRRAFPQSLHLSGEIGPRCAITHPGPAAAQSDLSDRHGWVHSVSILCAFTFYTAHLLSHSRAEMKLELYACVFSSQSQISQCLQDDRQQKVYIQH